MSGYPKISVTVDVIVFTIKENKLSVLLIKRGEKPFEDKWAIPGGFVRINESLKTQQSENFTKKQELKTFI